MIYGFFAFFGLALVLLQSLVLVALLPAGLVYDLLIPLVVYLSLFHPNGKTLFLLLCMGLIMDGITGGAMGIYMLTYFWIFVGIQVAVHFFQKDSPVLMVVAIILGVLLEYGLFLTVIALSGQMQAAEAAWTGGIIGRLMTAGITGPILLGLLKSFCRGMTTDVGI